MSAVFFSGFCAWSQNLKKKAERGFDNWKMCVGVCNVSMSFFWSGDVALLPVLCHGPELKWCTLFCGMVHRCNLNAENGDSFSVCSFFHTQGSVDLINSPVEESARVAHLKDIAEKKEQAIVKLTELNRRLQVWLITLSYQMRELAIYTTFSLKWHSPMYWGSWGITTIEAGRAVTPPPPHTFLVMVENWQLKAE